MAPKLNNYRCNVMPLCKHGVAHFWGLMVVKCWEHYIHGHYKFFVWQGKQDSLCPIVIWSAKTGSKTPVHLSQGASEGEGTQSRCLSTLVNSLFLKKKERKSSQRGSETRTATTMIGETSSSHVSGSLCPERRRMMKHISINSVHLVLSKFTLQERTSKQQNPAFLPHQALHKILIIS